MQTSDPLYPTISVITVTYNAGSLLLDTVASVCEQQYPGMEYIIIDGASNDGSLDSIPQTYRERINKLVSEPDRGIYDAMNKGMRHATGDYLCFMNAGDTFASSDTLLHALQGLRPPYPGVVYGQTLLVDEHRQVIGARHHTAPRTLDADSFRDGMVVCHQSFYALRSLAPMYDLRYRYSADVDWCVKVLQGSSSNHYTDTVLTHYLSEGATTKHRYRSLLERFEIMRHHYGLLPTLWSHLRMVLRQLGIGIHR